MIPSFINHIRTRSRQAHTEPASRRRSEPQPRMRWYR
jgi:hypothetical protein